MARRTLNLLYVQPNADIRLYKMARAVVRAGHRVSLACIQAAPSQIYRGVTDDVFTRVHRFQTPQQLLEISKDYDVVHSHNEPDQWTVVALAGPRPVIHDTHDMIALMRRDDQSLAQLEREANRGAAGRVYSTEEQWDIAQQIYGVTGPSIVLHNYASEDDLPQRMLPKLSEKDGETHLVYQGGVGGRPHRDFIPLLQQIAATGVHVHIYPLVRNERLAPQFVGQSHLHFHLSCPPERLLEELTQYDAGIIPFKLLPENREFLQCTIANKLYEYLAAGLPILASRLNTYERLFREMPVGMTFDSAEEAVEVIPRVLELADGVDLRSYCRTYESEVHRLEEFYFRLLDGVVDDTGGGPSTLGGDAPE